MANLSFAIGTIKMYSACLEDLHVLHRILSRVGAQKYYDTVIDPFFKEGQENGLFTGTARFTGTGKWDYGNNIEHFLPWMAKDMTEDERNLIQAIGFHLVFSYRDEEPGLAICGTGHGEIDHTADEPLSECLGRVEFTNDGPDREPEFDSEEELEEEESIKL